MQKINVVHSSTAQYKEDYLEKYGCAPNGGFIKDNDVKVIAAKEDCASATDCELSGSFGEGEKAEEEQVFGDRQRNSGLLMAMAFCIETPQVYVTAN